MRIALAVTNDLVTDQRVARTCNTLCDAGYTVTLIGRLLPDSQPISRPYKTIRMQLFFHHKAWFYAEYNLRLFFRLLFSKVDLIYANDTDTLLASYLVAKWRKKILFFDAHELFPEVPELANRPHVKHFWEKIEALCMPHIDGGVTVCQSIADIYHDKYGIEMGVVRNVPRMSAQVAPHPIQSKMILYQGAVNIGRGIDRMIDAMQFLPDYVFYIVGIGDEYNTMRQYAESKPWHDRIVFQGRQTPEQLRQITHSATLGICLLDNIGLNYYYSLPNRIGDFVAAGVPVLATGFPEIRRVVEKHRIGYLVQDEKGEDLALCIKKAVDDWGSLSESEHCQRFLSARNDLNWANDSQVLLRYINKAIDNHKII